MPTIDQTELGFLYPIETVIAETEKREPEIKKQPEMESADFFTQQMENLQ